jgi:N-dimethylarginine dimethylaminohydrolase
MKKVLLCPPTYYDIDYEINPWMDVNNKVDRQKAQEEYQQLKQVYQEHGLEVLEIPQEFGLPDMVYAANFGFPQNNLFIKSNYKFDERKPESELAKKYFQNLGFAIKELPENIFWEGQGDFLKVGKKYLLGWGKRSMFESKKYLADILQSDIIDLKLVDSYYYHIDMCMTPLTEEIISINPFSFDAEGLKKIHANFSVVIETSKADNKIMACNSFVIDKTIVIAQGVSEQLKNEYAKYGFSVREVPMEEFRKGGGSIKCLTLEFF